MLANNHHHYIRDDAALWYIKVVSKTEIASHDTAHGITTILKNFY